MQPKNVRSDVILEADLTPWLRQLSTELDAALADLAHTMQAVDEGSYTAKASGRKFGIVEVRFTEDATYIADQAIRRALENCLRSALSSFITFMDKLIASQQMKEEGGISIERSLSSQEEIHEYLSEYVARKISVVAGDTRLSNPKKLSRFPGLSDFSTRAALGFFALRRCIEHHQGIPQENIQFCVVRQRLFIDDIEATELPAPIRGRQNVQVRLLPEERIFPTGAKVVLRPEDLHGIVFTLLNVVGPEVFKVHVEQLQGLAPASELAR